MNKYLIFQVFGHSSIRCRRYGWLLCYLQGAMLGQFLCGMVTTGASRLGDEAKTPSLQRARALRPWSGCAERLTSRATAGAFLARDTEALAALPEAFTTDAELLGELGLAHLILMLEYEVLKIVLQR